MKINKRLIPLKLHFFLFSGGVAPVAPFMPVFAKQLGFSSVSFGWTQTLCPILVTLIKPLAGAFIDIFKSQRLILFLLIMISGIFGFSLQWIKPLPTSHTAQIKCNGSLLVIVCSEILKERLYVDKIKYTLITPVECKASVEKHLLENIPVSNDSEKSCSPGAYSKSNNGMSFPPEMSDLIIQLQGLSKIEDGCATMQAQTSNASNGFCHSSECQSISESMEMQCNDEFIQILSKKTTISDYEILSTPQFWCFSLLMVVCLLGYSLANSMSDVIAFELLGNKPENYGLQKLWAPLGWGITSMASGIMIDKLSSGKDEKDFTSSFYAFLFMLTLDALITSRIRIPIPEKSPSIKKDLKALFKKPKVITFAFWCFTNGFLFSFVWNFVLWYVEDLAADGSSESKDWIKTLDGLVLTTQCFAGEIPFTLFAGKIMKRLGHTNCMTFILFTFGVRFLLYSVLGNPWWILPIESLQGITYGLMYATMTTHASSISPLGAETTVQNIFSSLFEGAGAGIGGIAGGYLVSYFGVAKTFFILGVSSILLAFLHMIIQMCLDRLDETPAEEGRIYYSKEGYTLKEEKDALHDDSGGGKDTV